MRRRGTALSGTGRALGESETETLRPKATGRDPPLPQSGPSSAQSLCASRTRRAMASRHCPSPLLVRVSEPDISHLHWKLNTYFQSRILSDGGECTVRPRDPSGQGLFQVEFLEREGEPWAWAAGAKAVPAAQSRGVPGRPRVS